ncbi:MAG: SusF/SusE family outer membrane protein [Prevotella sp.]|nr:SusF/SusE family outer membrane protein [Prevotella sp.]
MKKLYKSLLMGLVVALPMAFTACEDDNDSNPTLSLPQSFVLNTPEFAANNVYDLPKSASVNLTTTQPDYGGWPAAVIYATQMSLTGEDDSWVELGTTSTSAQVKVNNNELNNAVLDAYRSSHDDADPEGPLAVFLRLRAYLSNSTVNLGEVYSNSVQINVLAYDPPVELSLPTALYVCGNSIGEAWKTWKPLAPVYGKEGRFYTLIYNGGDGFKWGTKPEEWLGYDRIKTFDIQVDGLEVTASSDGNIVFSKAGWYTLEFIAKIVGIEVQYTLVVAPGQAAVRGAAAGGDWDNDHLMTAPAGKGEWTYDVDGSGELRAFIVVPGEEWWRTEFTLFNGELYWRVVDIPNNWAEDLGSEYSVTVSTGKKLVINFDDNTGRVE